MVRVSARKSLLVGSLAGRGLAVDVEAGADARNPQEPKAPAGAQANAQSHNLQGWALDRPVALAARAGTRFELALRRHQLQPAGAHPEPARCARPRLGRAWRVHGVRALRIWRPTRPRRSRRPWAGGRARLVRGRSARVGADRADRRRWGAATRSTYSHAQAVAHRRAVCVLGRNACARGGHAWRQRRHPGRELRPRRSGARTSCSPMAAFSGRRCTGWRTGSCRAWVSTSSSCSCSSSAWCC